MDGTLPVCLTCNIKSFYSNFNLTLNVIVLCPKKNFQLCRHSNLNFTNYGTDQLGRIESFQKYSDDENIPSVFSKCAGEVNVPNLWFTSYSNDSNGHDHTFSTYNDNANASD